MPKSKHNKGIVTEKNVDVDESREAKLIEKWPNHNKKIKGYISPQERKIKIIRERARQVRTLIVG